MTRARAPRLLVAQPGRRTGDPRDRVSLPVALVRDGERLTAIVKVTARISGEPGVAEAAASVADVQRDPCPADLVVPASLGGAASHRVAPDAVLELTGLATTTAWRRVRLPGVAPRVRLVDEAVTEELVIDMVLERVSLDADERTLVLLWRGSFEEQLAEGRDLLVSIEDPAAPRTLDALADARARGELAWVWLAEDCVAGAPRPPPETLALARYAAWEAPREPSLPLATYAAIAAVLAEGREPPAQTYASAGLTEDAWTFEERAWLEQIGAAALDGDATLAAEYGAHFVAAQDALAEPGEEARTLEVYAALRAEIERAGEPSSVLADRRMSLAAWMRLDRRWTARAEAEPEVAAELERLVALEHARHPAEADEAHDGVEVDA